MRRQARQYIYELGRKNQLTDEVYVHQPHLLGSIVVLHQSFGASLEQIEPLLELLMAVWQAMKSSGRQWPLITEQLQDDRAARISAKMQFSHGMPAALRTKSVKQHIDHHPEPYLMALVSDELRKQGWQQVTGHTTQYIVSVAINLVECVAAATRLNPGNGVH